MLDEGGLAAFMIADRGPFATLTFIMLHEANRTGPAQGH